MGAAVASVRNWDGILRDSIVGRCAVWIVVPDGAVEVSDRIIPIQMAAAGAWLDSATTARGRCAIGMRCHSDARISTSRRSRRAVESIFPLHYITLGSVGHEASVGDAHRIGRVGRRERCEHRRAALYGANGGLTLRPRTRRIEASPSHSSCPGTDTANKGHHAAHSHPFRSSLLSVPIFSFFTQQHADLGGRRGTRLNRLRRSRGSLPLAGRVRPPGI